MTSEDSEAEGGSMKYIVEFEMQSDLGDAVRETVQKVLMSSLGSVEKLKIAPVPTYTWYIQVNNPIIPSSLRA
jgi:hypothetical protein